MLKTFIYILLAAKILFAQETEFRSLPNNAFQAGEKLTFEVKYGFVRAGIAEMAIPKMKTISGREAYHITFKVNSVSSFDPFFKVRDRYVTYLDKESLIPWRFEQHIREGGYTRDFSAFFDHRRGKVVTSNGKYEIPENVHDIVSAFYFVRTKDFTGMKKGDLINLQNFYKDKVHDLAVVYQGKEEIEVKAGKFKCIIIEPLVKEGGLFKQEGSILVWLTDDENKMPVKVQSKIVIGSIDAELLEFEGVKNRVSTF